MNWSNDFKDPEIRSAIWKVASYMVWAEPDLNPKIISEVNTQPDKIIFVDPKLNLNLTSNPRTPTWNERQSNSIDIPMKLWRVIHNYISNTNLIFSIEKWTYVCLNPVSLSPSLLFELQFRELHLCFYKWDYWDVPKTSEKSYASNENKYIFVYE